MVPFGNAHFAVVFLKDLSLLNQIPAGSKGPILQPLSDVRDRHTLFFDLANAETTAEGMAEYRERFGSLPPRGCAIVVDTQTGHVLSRILGCQPSLPDDEILEQEILAMRKCVRLWDMASNNKTEGLKKYIRWRADAGVLSVVYDGGADLPPDRPAPEPDVIASESVYPELRGQMSPDDVVTPAVLYIETVTNEHLDGRVTSRLLGNLEKKDLALYVVPRDLIGSIWLQFAEAVSGNKEFERCEVCGTWFEKSGRGRSRKDTDRKGRSDRQYCSARCKQEAYRQRKATALELHAQGKTAREIAQQVGTTAKTVNGWIASQRKKEKRNGKKSKGKG
jgi:hypothetical protein